MNTMISWIGRMLSESGGQPSASRTAMIYGVGFVSGMMAAMLWCIRSRPDLIAPILAATLPVYIGAVITGYGINQFSKKKTEEPQA